MENFRIKYSKDALKFLSTLDRKSVERIRKAIEGLAQKPQVGDIKPLQGFGDKRKRLRVGSWRVIFREDTDGNLEIIFVLAIGNRGDIYKKGGNA